MELVPSDVLVTHEGTRRVVVYIAMSLDGFIADRNGSVGWLNDIEPVEGDADFGYSGFYESIGALIMGRTTYDQVLTFGDWPYPGKRTYVVTSNPPDGDHPNVEFVSSDLKTFVDDVKGKSEKDIWHVGGGKLIAGFREHGLIDAYIITIIPVLLGAGIPLFPGNQPSSELRLVDMMTFDNGLVQLKYAAA